MFCSQCGTELIKEASFCHKCGVRLQTSVSLHRISDAVKTGISNDNLTAVTSNPSSSTDGRAARSTPKFLAAGSGPPIMTFHQFQRKKEGTRRSHFQPKSAKKQKLKEVKIKIGLITYRAEHDELRVSRGSSTNHAVSVPPYADVSEVIKKAVEKHSRFNRKLSDNPEEYYLLYPDKTRVDKLPGMEEDFTVERFKEELGKPYDRITLYLCKVTDFGNNMTSELAKVLGDVASEDEIEDTIIEHQVK